MAAGLAYSGWWTTGVVFWLLERRDRFVSFHAAQALATFGLVSVVVAGLVGASAVALSFLPSAAWALFLLAGVVWLAGLLTWGVVTWGALRGETWRIPFVAGLADRLDRGRRTREEPADPPALSLPRTRAGRL